MKNKKVLIYVLTYLGLTLFAFLIYYIKLPAINYASPSFWFFLTFLLLIYIAPFGFKKARIERSDTTIGYINGKMSIKNIFKPKFILLIAAVPVVVAMLGGIFSSTIFNAKKYANVITVEERVFKDDMPETENVTNVALMDSQSARIVGNRALGSLSDVVSQYEVSEYYNQINYMAKPKKVSNLEYADFFKWIGNKKNGIPGFVMVDPVGNTADYVKLPKAMKYAKSGYFGDDLMRKLRFSYPTKIMGEPCFEIDDLGNPFYIVPCMKPHVGMFGAMDVNQVILFDPCTGNSQIYKLKDVPTWVDIVFDGHLASKKYNWQGTLSGGWFNSIIGNKGCKHTTDDFGYIVLDDDVWYFTGVTSVTSDKSNIGFILTNARTGQYKFYPVIGAEEHSAMGAAEGEVQEKGYDASFPVLINVSGQATYIMVLKDYNGLVKLYALVNVEHYSIVATGETQEQAMKSYKKILATEGIIGGVDPEEVTYDIEIESVENYNIDGNTVFFYKVKGEDVYYRLSIAHDVTAFTIKAGDKIKVTRKVSEVDNIYYITSWKKIS